MVLLASPHFQRVKTNELLLKKMKWARGWWLFIITILVSYLSHAFCILSLLLFTFRFKEKVFFFPFREYTFSDCKENVGAGINTLMSISDGLGPSIFCRKMEKVRPMKQEMDGKVVYFPPDSAFSTLTLYFRKYFSLFVPGLGV